MNLDDAFACLSPRKTSFSSFNQALFNEKAGEKKAESGSVTSKKGIGIPR